ncbi:54S ribosomal protein L23, mitochondrial [Dispira simplex]|nr:54S ribosomal protein L23, mitochondrial [Dispira simplex]
MSTGIGNTALAYARLWHLVDAKGQILGRMSSRIATTLMGKHKPIYNPAAVYGMLPKNRLRSSRMDRLLVFADDKHPYQANISKIYDAKIPQACTPIE